MSPLPFNSLHGPVHMHRWRGQSHTPLPKLLRGPEIVLTKTPRLPNVLMRRLAKMLLEPARKPEAAKGK